MWTLIKLCMAALAFITSTIFTLAQAADTSRNNWLLAKYDLNGDAQISQDEIASKKRNIFTHMDSDNDGVVSFSEYETMDIAKRSMLIKARFNKLDLDQDGIVTEKEYCNYLGLFESLDSDGDGIVTSADISLSQPQATTTHCLLWFCIRSDID